MPRSSQQAVIDLLVALAVQEPVAQQVGKVPEAANLLGLGRATLYRKIEEYGIDR